MDKDLQESMIADCFTLAAKIIDAVETDGTPRSSEELTIVASDFYGSYWSVPKHGQQDERSFASPAEPLPQALDWIMQRPVR